MTLPESIAPPPASIETPYRYPKQRHNLLAFGTDFVFFGLALSFISPTTILPAFATSLGVSKNLIGLLITVYYLSWDLPQIVAGNIVASHAQKKPVLVRMTYIGRPAVVLFAIWLLISGGQPVWISLLLLFVMVIILFGTDAFAAIAWLDLLGRAFPPERRGGYLSIWQAIKGLGVLGVAVLTRFILSEIGPSFPHNFALLFGAGGMAFLISAVALSLIHEPPLAQDESGSAAIAWRDFGPHLIRIWQQDHRLRQVTIARVLLALGTMASGFYVLFATEVLNFPSQAIAFFITAQTIGALGGSLILGRIADVAGSERVIQIGTVLVLTAPLLALTLALLTGTIGDVLRQGYIWVYVSIGIAENVVILGFLNYILDVTPPGQRTIYMGVSNTISGLGVLGPVIAGWLLTLTSYRVLFAVSSAFGVIALILALRLPAPRETDFSGSAASEL